MSAENIEVPIIPPATFRLVDGTVIEVTTIGGWSAMEDIPALYISDGLKEGADEPRDFIVPFDQLALVELDWTEIYESTPSEEPIQLTIPHPPHDDAA